MLVDLVAAAEKIANNQKYPAEVHDWADSQYRQLIDRNGIMTMADLIALDVYIKDEQGGLFLINRRIIGG